MITATENQQPTAAPFSSQAGLASIRVIAPRPYAGAPLVIGGAR